MRTAKELAEDYWRRPQPQRGFMPFIREVQADALNAAIKIIEDYPDTDTPISDFTEELRKLRDKALKP